MQWRLIGNDVLQFRSWNDECVVYNTLSGDTHILETRAAEILFSLQEGALNMLSLAQLLADKWRCETSQIFLDELETVLLDMHALSLVEHA